MRHWPTPSPLALGCHVLLQVKHRHRAVGSAQKKKNGKPKRMEMDPLTKKTKNFQIACMFFLGEHALFFFYFFRFCFPRFKKMTKSMSTWGKHIVDFMMSKYKILDFCLKKPWTNKNTKRHTILEPQTASWKWMEMVISNHFPCKDLMIWFIIQLKQFSMYQTSCEKMLFRVRKDLLVCFWYQLYKFRVLLEKLLGEAPSKTYVSLLIPSAMAVQMRNLRFVVGWQVLGIKKEQKKAMTVYISMFYWGLWLFYSYLWDMSCSVKMLKSCWGSYGFYSHIIRRFYFFAGRFKALRPLNPRMPIPSMWQTVYFPTLSWWMFLW